MKTITFEQLRAVCQDRMDASLLTGENDDDYPPLYEMHCEVASCECCEKNCPVWNGLPDVPNVPKHYNALLDSLFQFSMNGCNCGDSFVDINGRKRCICMAAADRISELEKRWQERQR